MWYSHFLDSERELSIFAPMFMENQWYMINDVLWWLILVINVVNTISQNSPCCVWVLWAIPKWYVSLLGFLQYIYIYVYIYMLVGGFNHLEKYESQWEGLSHILWKTKTSWNHQPVYVYTYSNDMLIFWRNIFKYIYIYIRNRSLSRVVEAEYCHTAISLINSVVSIRLK
jgi:hypothetical protein